MLFHVRMDVAVPRDLDPEAGGVLHAPLALVLALEDALQPRRGLPSLDRLVQGGFSLSDLLG